MTNPIREYAWGSRTAFSDLFGWAPSVSPQAEIWMGSHPAAPSFLETGDKLSDVPFMVKVLAAEIPLSIQAHPSQQQAQTGFADEQTAGIAVDAPERTYRDPHHKPELALALTPFIALSGFDTPDAVVGRLTQVQRLIAEGDLAVAIEALSVDILREDYATAVRSALEDPSGLLSVAAEELSMRDTSSLEPALADTLKRTSTSFPGDSSIFVALMLHRVDLSPGEALYVAPGTLHAYLHGAAIEVQACSDNVVRGGLTSKYIDVGGLLKTINTAPETPRIVEPTPLGSGVLRYATEAKEFQLTQIDFPAVGAEYRTDGAGPMIALCTSGHLTTGEISLSAGESAYIADGVSEVLAGDDARLLITQPRSPETQHWASTGRGL
ncbi:mannose-6-phosphate isomerase, class I [Nesterenkonia haasae]|uniref:mannose-6-phosphate isomerase, class I n=1 Tax=Nesterenkonia haasae TaxID=2587813 RepID=UPI001390A6C4|nr:mannose-6-phosphate isomerase, class I [Nesterenkonia haasae]NDK31013.1 mannose-6-phosphate isomerase, class I [Nesterenkonia haasae]